MASQNAQTAATEPRVANLDDARFWIGVMHRRTCQDAEALYALAERVRRLEQPWWKRWRHGS